MICRSDFEEKQEEGQVGYFTTEVRLPRNILSSIYGVDATIYVSNFNAPGFLFFVTCFQE